MSNFSQKVKALHCAGLFGWVLSEGLVSHVQCIIKFHRIQSFHLAFFCDGFAANFYIESDDGAIVTQKAKTGHLDVRNCSDGRVLRIILAIGNTRAGA